MTPRAITAHDASVCESDPRVGEMSSLGGDQSRSRAMLDALATNVTKEP